VSQAGDALDEADITAAIDPTLQPGLIHPGDFYIGGLDLGIKHDHSALVVLAGSHQTLQLRLVSARAWKPDSKSGKVDLIAVEQAVLDAHQRYKFRSVGFDPYQAELLSQRLSARGVPMEEMTFTGANLNRMASTLLDVFRSRRLTLYNHPALIADLGRLSIEEKSYGHRLAATSNESGHADLATALAIALPLAVDAGGNPPIRLSGDLFAVGRTAHSPHDEWAKRQSDYRREQEEAIASLYQSANESLVRGDTTGPVRVSTCERMF
jgi:phage terminase large subunit-like protein